MRVRKRSGQQTWFTAVACHSGDVVLARSMQNPKQTVCKRVLGMEGDEVRVRQSSRMGPGRTVLVSRNASDRLMPGRLCSM